MPTAYETKVASILNICRDFVNESQNGVWWRFPPIGQQLPKANAVNLARMYELDKTDPISRDAVEKSPSTHVMERYFVKVRRRPRRMACFVNFDSDDRIICAIFNCLKEGGYRTVRHSPQAV